MNRTSAVDPSVAALAACLIGVATFSLAVPAQAQVLTSGKHLSLDLAVDAAQAALHSCETSGYRVSVSVVDVSGVELAYLRGDHSTIHTRETSFKKAYTIATLGPIFGVTTTSALTEKISKTPTGPAMQTVNNIILLAGGASLRSGDETLAAIGVGGAPGGALDETCAMAGVAKVQDRLNKLSVEP